MALEERVSDDGIAVATLGFVCAGQHALAASKLAHICICVYAQSW